jgi:hypothetical protein
MIKNNNMVGNPTGLFLFVALGLGKYWQCQCFSFWVSEVTHGQKIRKWICWASERCFSSGVGTVLLWRNETWWNWVTVASANCCYTIVIMWSKQWDTSKRHSLVQPQMPCWFWTFERGVFAMVATPNRCPPARSGHISNHPCTYISII